MRCSTSVGPLLLSPLVPVVCTSHICAATVEHLTTQRVALDAAPWLCALIGGPTSRERKPGYRCCSSHANQSPWYAELAGLHWYLVAWHVPRPAACRIPAGRGIEGCLQCSTMRLCSPASICCQEVLAICNKRNETAVSSSTAHAQRDNVEA